MASFDVVSKLDVQLVDNAINQANRKIGQRYDFKGAHILVELNKKEKTLKVEAPDDKIKAVQEIIVGEFITQKISPKIVDWGKKEDAHLGVVRMNCKLVEGIDKDVAREIQKRIKDSGLKVKSSIQGDQLRVEAKQIDDLQGVITLLNESDLPVPLQYVNMKR
jgi:uncharacterized protein YajQ (UPF0234 family)